MAERDYSDELHSDNCALFSFWPLDDNYPFVVKSSNFFSLVSFRVLLVCRMFFHENVVKISSRNIEGNESCGRSDMYGPVWRARRVMPPPFQ